MLTERMNIERIVVLTVALDADGATHPADGSDNNSLPTDRIPAVHTRFSSLTKTKK
jgi:hypothetical protein